MSKKSTHATKNLSRILLIEDDFWLADIEAETLTRAGFAVAVAHNALEAIEQVDTQVPAVIVADVLLAGSTIFTLLNELQSHDDTQGVPVVLCTSIAEQFTASALLDYGVKRIVDKTTMEPDALVVAVRAVLGGER